jgi:predicted DNA-binding transcriptional regulator YafY
MPKRPDTLETVLLALELLRRIPRKRKVSASELHEQLTAAGVERDLRTIQRQLEMLSEHFDIERDSRNKPYGYQWKDRAVGMTLPMLSEQESLMLTLAEQQLRNLMPAGLMKSMEGFFVQARSNLDPQSSAKLEREWLSKVRVISETQPLLAPKIKAGVFEEVSNALYGNRWLEIEYKNVAAKVSKTDVMPLGLAQQGSRLYLVCRFRDFDNERSLALHRLISAKTSTLTFMRPKDFDLQKYDNDGRFGFGEGTRILLSFLISKDSGFYLLETPLSTDQKVTEVGDQLQISATVVDTAQLQRWLLGFGDEISEVRKEAVVSNSDNR